MKTLLRMLLIVASFGAVCALAVSFRMHRVHEQTGEWRLRPDAAPPTLRLEGRLYDRAERAKARLPWLNGDSKTKDFGGGLVLLPIAGQSHSEIQVRYHGRYYDYRQAG